MLFVILSIFCVGVVLCLIIHLCMRTSYFKHDNTTMTTYIIIPQRDRDIYMEKLLEELPLYLKNTHPGMSYEIVVSHQGPDGKYNKSLSINVALAWLYKVKRVPPSTPIIVHDVDVIPLEYVDYRPVHMNKLVGCFLTIGGVKGRLWQFIKCNGYANTMMGWGYEDMLLWSRMEKMCGINVSWWKNEIKNGTKAVVKNLEWNMNASDTKKMSDNYWKNMNFSAKIMFVSGGISQRPERSWRDEETTAGNWCLYRKTNNFDHGTFSRIVNSDGINNVIPGGIKYEKDGPVNHLYFDVIDVYNKGKTQPELEWYDDLSRLPEDCPTDIP